MNKKIDIFVNGHYFCSTKWSKTCKEAIVSIKKKRFAISGKITAHFAKNN